MSILIHYYKLRLNAPSSSEECDVFRAAAIDTWNRIGFSRTRPLLKIHETTITQNLVYELHLLKRHLPLRFSIFESTDEKANGDDLEIMVKDSSGSYITFATQSKVIYHNLPVSKGGHKYLGDGRYYSMEHYTGKKKRVNQVDLLLKYAEKNGSIPIYLLYNYVNRSLPTQVQCDISFEADQYGCSIVSAHYLKNNYQRSNGNLRKTIRFTDLHPTIAMPWFKMICCFSNMSTDEIITDLGASNIGYEIRKVTDDAIFNAPGWRLMETLTPNVEFNQSAPQDRVIFRPMHRFVFGQ